MRKKIIRCVSDMDNIMQNKYQLSNEFKRKTWWMWFICEVIMICTHRTCNHHSCAQSFILFFGDDIVVKKNPKDPKHTNQNKYTNGSPNAGKVQNMMMSAIRMFFRSGKIMSKTILHRNPKVSHPNAHQQSYTSIILLRNSCKPTCI